MPEKEPSAVYVRVFRIWKYRPLFCNIVNINIFGIFVVFAKMTESAPGAKQDLTAVE
jgi:hypothetical protein